MTANPRSALWVPLFDELADPLVVPRLATSACKRRAAVLVGGDLGAARKAAGFGGRVRLLASPRIRVAVAGMVVAQVVMVALMIAAPLNVDHHGHGLGLLAS